MVDFFYVLIFQTKKLATLSVPKLDWKFPLL